VQGDWRDDISPTRQRPHIAILGKPRQRPPDRRLAEPQELRKLSLAQARAGLELAMENLFLDSLIGHVTQRFRWLLRAQCRLHGHDRGIRFIGSVIF
jgi:hypothetical protein